MDGFLHEGRRTRTGPLVAIVAAAGLGLTGCVGTAVPPPAPQPAPATSSPGGAAGEGTGGSGTAGTDTVAWTDRICTALLPVVETLRTPPPVDVTDPAAAQGAYRDYLAEAQSRAETAQQEVTAAGAPPVDGGEELAQDVQQQVEDLQEDVTEARRQIDAADPGNPIDIGQAVVVGGNVLGAIGNNVQAVGTLTTDSELSNAFDAAPACADLRRAGTPS